MGFGFKLFHLIVNILVEQARNINNSNGKNILILFSWKALQLKLPETFFVCLLLCVCVCVYVYASIHTMRGYIYDKRFVSVGRFDICISFLQSFLIEFSENNPMSQVCSHSFAQRNVENWKVYFNLNENNIFHRIYNLRKLFFLKKQ